MVTYDTIDLFHYNIVVEHCHLWWIRCFCR